MSLAPHRVAAPPSTLPAAGPPDLSDPRLLAETRRYVLSLLRSFGAPPEECEDLAQDVFLRLVEQAQPGRTSFRGRERGSWFRYVSVITRRRMSDWRRRRPLTLLPLPSPSEAGLDDRDGEVVCEPAPLHSPTIDPLDRLLGREEVLAFHRACRRVVRHRKDRRRVLRILRWAWVDGLSTQEIAQRLARRANPATIDSLISRSRARLRRTIDAAPARRGARRPRRRIRRCGSTGIGDASTIRRRPGFRSAPSACAGS